MLVKMNLSITAITMCLLLSSVTLAGASPSGPPPKDTTPEDSKVDCNPTRIEQAKRIIEDSKSFCRDAKLLIAQSEQSIQSAKKLQGEARQYTKNVRLHAPMLKGKALSDAKHQFQLDLAQFSKHAQQYKVHTDSVRKQFGQCAASMKAYEQIKRELELHCDQFHLPNIAPPHICLEMSTSVQEAASIQNQLAEQGRRMAVAEKQLMEAESRLNKADKMSEAVDGIVRAQSEVALKEQELAAEFARLREEHRQLDVERQALKRSGVQVSTPRVRGQVKK